MHDIIRRALRLISEESLSAIEALTIIAEEQDLSDEEIAAICKNDKTFMQMLETNCNDLGLLKGNRNSSIRIDDLI